MNGSKVASSPAPVAEITVPEKAQPKGNRVFITHGKNMKILEQVKDRRLRQLRAVVAQERDTIREACPRQSLRRHASCRAAVIHVAVEDVIVDKDGKSIPQINGNVLIEIGAAIGLYPGKKLHPPCRGRVKLPSNLQGLYECRYEATSSPPGNDELLKAFNEFK